MTTVEFCSLGELDRLGSALCNGMLRESVQNQGWTCLIDDFAISLAPKDPRCGAEIGRLNPSVNSAVFTLNLEQCLLPTSCSVSISGRVNSTVL